MKKNPIIPHVKVIPAAYTFIKLAPDYILLRVMMFSERLQQQQKLQARPIILYITLNPTVRAGRQTPPFQASAGLPALICPTFS